MSNGLVVRLQKSTTVRASEEEPEGRRSFAWWLASRLAPGWVDRAALRRFGRAPRTPSAAPQVDGLPTHRFWVEADGERLAAYDWGERGPTVLLAHGWGGTAAQLAGFVRPLLAAGFQVVAFDQPAHGASTGRYTNVVAFAAATRAVAAKVDRLHAVIGHSLGGTGALLAVAGGLPAERAVLLAAPVEVRPFALAFARSLGLPPERQLGLLDEIAARFGDLDRLDLRLRAPALALRGLLIHDPRDREVSFQGSVELAAAWPGARLRAVERLGHRRLLADPRVISEAVAFVGRGGDDERILPR